MVRKSDIPDVYFFDFEATVEDCCRLARWTFVYPGSTRKHSGDCVYFMRGTLYPGTIKIGLAQRVFSRRQTLRYEYGGRFEVLAYASVLYRTNADYFEKALHKHFAEAQTPWREFFWEEPVLRFLDEIKQVVTAA